MGFVQARVSEWSLSTFPNPILELQHALLPPKVLWAKERAPTPPSSVVFYLDSHLNLSKSWECVNSIGPKFSLSTNNGLGSLVWTCSSIIRSLNLVYTCCKVIFSINLYGFNLLILTRTRLRSNLSMVINGIILGKQY